MQWNSIDTAPMGRPVLLWNGETMAVGIGTDHQAPVFLYGSNSDVFPNPTHWMELPDPPGT